ncbi:hypothetical protein [Oceanibaculum indicum]|uniref:hypothetical protein n=1 Tax=Oceanibaculum indicum TaxID=526216 RepID=UPI0012EAEA6F|nr:hypothetical protein [Oceanibaculum indicum]
MKMFDVTKGLPTLYAVKIKEDVTCKDIDGIYVLFKEGEFIYVGTVTASGEIPHRASRGISNDDAAILCESKKAIPHYK